MAKEKPAPKSIHEQIREQAKKKVDAKMTIYTIMVVFAFSSAILMALSFILAGPVIFWLRFAIFVMALTLAFLYLIMIGIPNAIGSNEWQEEEIEKEIARAYRRNRPSLPPEEELSEEDRLELKELDRLTRKWGREDDFV